MYTDKVYLEYEIVMRSWYPDLSCLCILVLETMFSLRKLSQIVGFRTNMKYLLIFLI